MNHEKIRESAGEISELSRESKTTTGHLGAFSVMSAVAGVVPLPFVTDPALHQIRGALCQSVLSRHGLVLTAEARRILVEEDALMAGKARSAFGRVAAFATGRLLARWTPFFGIVSPAVAASNTFVLGSLLDRYCVRHRSIASIRFEKSEAEVVRRAIDVAWRTVLAREESSALGEVGIASEDFRSTRERLFDAFLIRAASVPDWAVHRLERAFDRSF
ncbi:MAG: hypothetical protein KBF88_15660 [Polyangiaceae bacterium]|nr:hypothetical protein [Polyangiaceae bacterium]